MVKQKRQTSSRSESLTYKEEKCMKKAMSPKDIIPDGVDEIILNGVKIRKGSAAAAFASARV